MDTEHPWKRRIFAECSRPHCHELRSYWTLFTYIGGRSGRAKEATTTACRAHAETFAKRHHVPMPEPVLSK